jgi:2-polyprenyl-3-methyl-5-hydroxy-6-metoxy-1,4-benzoquinol methylase
LNHREKENTISRYNSRLKEYGYSEKTLGWSRNKSNIRFDALITQWKSDLNGSKIADFGCGFGDFYGHLKDSAAIENFKYTGIDINEDLIETGRKQYPTANFWVGDILENDIDKTFDFIFSSGVFNHKFMGGNEYNFIEECLNKLFKLCEKGLAVDFLSDKVDYTLDHTFHASPQKILEMCYNLTNNVVLRNDFMPFEFTVYLRKDKAIEAERLVYI